MAGRRRTELTPQREEALVTELRLLQRLAREAEEELKVHVFRASEAGMSLAKIRDALELKSADTTRRWRAEGEQVRARRRSDTGDSGEHPTLG